MSYSLGKIETVSRSEQGQLKLYAEDDEESFRVAEDEAGYGLEERIARLEAEMKEDQTLHCKSIFYHPLG